ncbi:MAG: FtsX-like permease family protein [Chloroflexota bacterium]
MIEKLNFYFRHSLNDLRVNGQRTFFALLCIAAGVAAVVSLQTVAIMIGDTLTGNLQQTNRGDIQVALNPSFDGNDPSAQTQQAINDGILEEQKQSSFFGDGGFSQYHVGETGIAKIQAWIDANYPGQIQMTYPWSIGDFTAVFTGGIGTSLTVTASGNYIGQLSPVLIDPKVYPFYDTVQSVEGKPLADLIQSPTDIVLDQKVATNLGTKVGDVLRINGSDTDFTVRGLVPTESEVTDPGSGLFMAIFGFYYLDRDAIQYFDGLTPQTDKLYLKLSDPAQTPAINRAFKQAFPFFTTTTVDDLKVGNQELSDRINQVVTVVGLVSLLLGSIGIINTMQVIVRRRTVEIAVLKTIGLQAGQVTMLFLVEAFIMGVIGSIAGIVLGWVTTFLIKGVAESVVAQQLPFRIALLPVVNGLIVGTLVTTIFGFLPTLAAGQVRPGVVLRPNDNIIPRAGWLRTLLALVVIIAALSVVAYTILGNFALSLGVTIGAFFAAGFLILLLSFLIWIIGRFFPSLGIVDLKISLRQMLAGRARGATTLLALVVGVFSLSLITLFADSINNLLSTALDPVNGGNVIIALINRGALPAVTTALDSTDGVQNYQVLQNYSGNLISVEEPDGTVLTRDQIKARIGQNSTTKKTVEAFGGDIGDMNVGESELGSLGSMTGRDVNLAPPNPIVEGRNFTADDAGKPVIVMGNYSWLTDAGLKVGDKLTYDFGDASQKVTLELIGISQRPTISSIAGGNGTLVPLAGLPDSVQPSSVQVLANVDEKHIPDVRRALSRAPGTFVVETSVFAKLLTGLLGTFTAFPTMVALLGLIVGGVVIANSVALTTMERRREIAVMKAVGLQRERVLGMLLLENGLMGLIGGLIGVGLGVLMLLILLSFSGGLASVIPYGTALLLMLLCILVALIAAATTAWGASGEKPLNVLRYE